LSDSEDEITLNSNTTTTSGNISVAAPQNLNVQSTGLQESWFSQFAQSKKNTNFTVPDPSDLRLFMSFKYQNSSELLHGCMQFLEELELQKIEISTAEDSNKLKAQSLETGRGRSKSMGDNQN
jgi:hypothetical protein